MGVAGDPQFQLVFTVVDRGATSITIGAHSAYGDHVVGTGGAFLSSTNSLVF